MDKQEPNREKLIKQVALKGIDDAERLCAGLTASSIQATLAWYEAQRNASPRLLAWKLSRDPILVAEGDEPPSSGIVWTENRRLAWIERNLPEEIERDHGFEAEIAVVGIVRAKLPVTAARVRKLIAAGETSR